MSKEKTIPSELEHIAEIDTEKYKTFLSHECAYNSSKRSWKAGGPGIGGGLSYTYSPNGVFVGLTVKCACGKSEDITDYNRI